MNGNQNIQEKWDKFLKTRDFQNRNILIKHYSHLVKGIVNRSLTKLSKNIVMDNVITAAIFGLIDAIDNYKPTSNVKFEEYCELYITKRIHREAQNMDWVPKSIRTNAYKIFINGEVGYRAFDEDTLLHCAVEEDSYNTVEYLLKVGAIVNVVNKNGYTPLHYAARKGFSDIVDLLLQNSSNPNYRTNDGETPLHLACCCEYIEYTNETVVQLLIEAGANVHIRDNYGQTPLHLAAYYGNSEVVELLLKHGADVNARTNDNYTPLHFAIINYWEIIRRKEIVTSLLLCGAKPNIKNKEGKTPLKIAKADSDMREIHKLLSIASKTNISNEEIKKRLNAELTRVPTRLEKVIKSFINGIIFLIKRFLGIVGIGFLLLMCVIVFILPPVIIMDFLGFSNIFESEKSPLWIVVIIWGGILVVVYKIVSNKVSFIRNLYSWFSNILEKLCKLGGINL